MPLEWMPMEWSPMELRQRDAGARPGSSHGGSVGKPPPGPKTNRAEGRKLGPKQPLAHVSSLRDNWPEHRIFLPNPLDIAVAAPVFNLPTTV